MEIKMNTFLVCTKEQTHDGYTKDVSDILEVHGAAQNEYELQKLTSRITKAGHHTYVIPCMDISPITKVEIQTTISVY